MFCSISCISMWVEAPPSHDPYYLRLEVSTHTQVLTTSMTLRGAGAEKDRVPGTSASSIQIPNRTKQVWSPCDIRELQTTSTA